MIDHMDRLIKLKGETAALLEMRTHGPWYIKGLRNASSMKREIAQIRDRETFINMVNRYKKELNI
jgi:tRNA-dihydrouridine synthase